jgi:hypothetical protein
MAKKVAPNSAASRAVVTVGNSGLPPTSGGPARPGSRQRRPGIVHTSLYLPEGLYKGLRVAAFRERRKIHDIVLEGIETALRKRGGGNDGRKAKHERKGR